MKRKDYIDWESYFMGVAILSSKRSKDPVTQVGACIVNNENRIVSIGYNGLPNNCSDDKFPWDKVGSLLQTKYAYVCHAELNCILNRETSIKDCKMYVTLFPCNECAKAIIQSGIKEVIYLDDKYINSEQSVAAMQMFQSANVKITKFNKTIDSIKIVY